MISGFSEIGYNSPILQLPFHSYCTMLSDV